MLQPTSSRSGTSSTFVSRGTKSLARLCEALDFGPGRDKVLALFEDVIAPWGARTIGPRPDYPSNIGDDHSPFEFSVVFGGSEPELRVLWEAQGDPPDPRSNQEAARALTDRLTAKPGFSIDRLRMIEDLYLPDEPAGGFSLWHAVCLWRDRPPAYKVYLNPNVRGPEHSEALVSETLARLGFPRAWHALASKGCQRGRALDALAYVSLDLDPGPTARLKIYYRHYAATTKDLEQVFSAQEDYISGEVTKFCHTIAGESGPFCAKPVQTCFSFVSGDTEGPSRVTLYFPIASYVSSDAVVRERFGHWLTEKGLPVEQYYRVLDAAAERPLDMGSGLQSYVSFRQDPSGPRATVYLSPELYRLPVSGTFTIPSLRQG